VHAAIATKSFFVLAPEWQDIEMVLYDRTYVRL